MANELRQGLNKIELTGVVKESKLAENENQNGKYINGSLVVKTGENSEIELKVYVKEKNNEGNVKKAFSTLKQFVTKEAKTMADGLTEEEATKVRVWSNNDTFCSQFNEERYKGQNGEAVTKISLSLGFGNITIDDRVTKEDYKATFDIEVFVDNIKDEMKNEEETGRVIIKGWCPVFDGTVIPLNVVAGKIQDEEGELDFAEIIKDNIDPKTTLNIWGDINFQSLVTKIKKGGGLGRAKVEDKREFINDLVANGAEVIEDEGKEFDEELIKKAIQEREIKLEEIKNEVSQKNNNVKGKGLTTGNKSPKTREIPF